jgi:hypothetical protein
MMDLRPFAECRGLSLAAEIKKVGEILEFRYVLAGNIGDVVVPPHSLPARTDELWKSTCFEAFIETGDASYVELNFAPSGQWAAYSFDDYREGMRELDIVPPKISFANNRLVATVELAARPGSALNLSAVIERGDGGRSYWALAHPEGRPDFHARDCFVAKVP